MRKTGTIGNYFIIVQEVLKLLYENKSLMKTICKQHFHPNIPTISINPRRFSLKIRRVRWPIFLNILIMSQISCHPDLCKPNANAVDYSDNVEITKYDSLAQQFFSNFPTLKLPLKYELKYFEYLQYNPDTLGIRLDEFEYQKFLPEEHKEKTLYVDAEMFDSFRTLAIGNIVSKNNFFCLLYATYSNDGASGGYTLEIKFNLATYAPNGRRISKVFLDRIFLSIWKNGEYTYKDRVCFLIDKDLSYCVCGDFSGRISSEGIIDTTFQK
jgi:hypothetical protein